MTVQTYGQWEIYPGNESTSLALPDYYSIYLAYTYDITLHPNTRLRITGDFPSARYMSFNIYATRSGTSLAALTDYQLKTDARNVNPFVAGSDQRATNRRYVVNVEPQTDESAAEQASSDSAITENLLTYNPKALNVAPFPEALLTVVIRYYVPVGLHGNAEPPRVEVLSMEGSKPLDPQPKSYPTNMAVNEPIFRYRLAPIFESVDGDGLRFYHSEGKGQFNNADNLYLISAVDGVDGENNVVILRVVPPTFPRDNKDFDKTDVRYWSINQGNPDTSTPVGIRDGMLRPAKDGFIYLVMGGKSVELKATEGGYNYMPWLADKERAVIIYRNMLTNPQYRGSIMRVPQLPEAPWDKQQLAAYEASLHIGDYAPAGKKVTAQEFNSNYGGMPSPGFAPRRPDEGE
jgi:hypothetical protein